MGLQQGLTHPLALWFLFGQYHLRGSEQLSAMRRGNVPYFSFSYALKWFQLRCRGMATEPRAKFALLVFHSAAFSLIFNDYKLLYS